MNVLVLTATIAPPPGGEALQRSDVDLRKEDYRKAFSHYCKGFVRGGYDRLVFIDNSGRGGDFLKPIAEAAGVADLTEFLCYDAAADNAGATRFYGECRLLKYGSENSQSIAEARATGGVVWKVTGRYIVSNLGAIIDGAPADADLYLHCRNRPMRFVDFGVAGFAAKSASALIDIILAAPGVRERNEAVLRTLIDDGAFEKFRVAPRFAVIPDFQGVRGSDNASYGGGAYRLKYALRVAANRVAPGLWL